MKDHIGITIERELLKEIETARGLTKRSTFMEYLLRLGIKAHKKQQRTPETSEPIFNAKGESME